MFCKFILNWHQYVGVKSENVILFEFIDALSTEGGGDEQYFLASIIAFELSYKLRMARGSKSKGFFVLNGCRRCQNTSSLIR